MSNVSLFGICAAIAIVISAPAIAESSPEARDLSIEQRPYADVVPSSGGTLRVDASIDHNSHVYSIGEVVQLSVRPNEDAYITVFDIGSSGRATRLFPNRASDDNFVRGGHTLVLPDNARWSIGVGGPRGVDLIKIIASKSNGPIFRGRTIDGPVFSDLDEPPQTAARDLDVVLNTDHRSRWAETRQYIRIVGRDHSDNSDFDHVHHHLNAGTEVDALNILSRLPRHSAFDLDLSLSHDDGVYDEGDALSLSVTAERDCNLKVIDIGSSGDATVIFPNRAQRRTHINAGETVTIPSANSEVRYGVRSPSGLEELVAVCRADDDRFLEQSWNWEGNMFQTYGGGSRSFARDLEVVLHDDHNRGGVAYSSVNFRVRR